MEHELVKKAYKVYHLGMISENPHEGYTFDNLPITYAESHSEAKKKGEKHLFEYEIDGKPHTFIDIKTVRAKNADMILFEGKEMPRYEVERYIADNKYKSELIQKISKYPDTELFYIQKGYVGNCMQFWALGDRGYTCKFNSAQQYTKEQILSHYINISKENKFWPVSYLANRISSVVDSQNVDYSEV